MSLESEQPSGSAGQEVQPKKKQKIIQVAKVEVSGDVAKFFVAKGFGKKRWVVVREIPILEIEHIEKFGNELTVTWKGNTESFLAKEKNDPFGSLANQVNTILADQQKTTENEEKTLRKNELLTVINTSINIIDSSFNVLIGLQEKQINWQQIEDHSNGFGENLSFTGQTIPSLNLDFSQISSAIKKQLSKESSNEAYSILKAEYAYFSGLNFDDEPEENHPNFHDAKAVILAYFLLNDLLLAKVVGDKENTEEIIQLETVLQNLAAETNFKLDINELRGSIDKINADGDEEKFIERSREIFKEQLKQL